MALKRAGLRADKTLVYLGEFREQSGYVSIREMLENDNMPDGVFTENDLLAMGVV